VTATSVCNFSQDSSYIAGNSTHHLALRTELTW